MPLFKEKKIQTHPLLQQHCRLLNSVNCYELFVSIPKEFPLKTPQLSCKVFISSLAKGGFSEGHGNLRSPSTAVHTHLGSVAGGARGRSP